MKNTKSTAKQKSKNNKSKNKNRVLLYLTFILLFIIFIFCFTLYNYFSIYQNGGINISKNASQNQEVNFNVEEGEGLKSISFNLKQAGIIENDLFFRIKAQQMGIDKNFKPGEFLLNKSMNFSEITEILQSISHNNESQIKFLIKEGETQDDIARNLEKLGIISYDDFMQVANNSDFQYDFLKQLPKNDERKSKLEGYLYPDTYFIKKGEDAKTIINKFLDRFEQLYNEKLIQATYEKGMTIDQVVTIASIIEKEIKNEYERPIAASVIFNRLEKNMPLQMDATVLYAKKQHSDRTTIEDTKFQSPYNTYYVKGLPIGPISNPRIQSIEAVLYPKDTNYIYYVVKDTKTGEHFYTDDYNEFLEAKRKYLKNFD